MSGRRPQLSAALALSAVLLAACSGSAETKPEPAAQPVAELPLIQPAAASGMQQPELAQHSVYFDFDKSDIRPEGERVIGSWAGYMAAHPAQRLRIEGNCDERGTREYNVGLGERRANDVARALEAKGIPAVQLELISYGKERPVALGHDEASWARNRRADLVEK